ncbi:MAG: ABC transporter permease [Planctomycetaceae bacterium]|jgi:putative ABC transport system permease protein
MNLLISSLTIGFILAFLALGVFLSFRIFSFPDITAEGSFTLGGAVTAALLSRAGWPVWLATFAGGLAGMLAGTLTGVLHTRFRINPLLSGILVTTGLYSVNLHIMGSSNIPLTGVVTLAQHADRLARTVLGDVAEFNLLGWSVAPRDAGFLLGMVLLTGLVSLALSLFFRTHRGTVLRATGENPQMVRALGSNVDLNLILGLALSNGLIALSGSLLAQSQGFADVQMGIGMVVWGMASVIIGEGLVGSSRVNLLIVGAIMGSVLFRLMIAIALRWGLPATDLKLITALFVFVALVGPTWLRRWTATAPTPDRKD